MTRRSRTTSSYLGKLTHTDLDKAADPTLPPTNARIMVINHPNSKLMAMRSRGWVTVDADGDSGCAWRNPCTDRIEPLSPGQWIAHMDNEVG